MVINSSRITPIFSCPIGIYNNHWDTRQIRALSFRPSMQTRPRNWRTCQGRPGGRPQWFPPPCTGRRRRSLRSRPHPGSSCWSRCVGCGSPVHFSSFSFSSLYVCMLSIYIRTCENVYIIRNIMLVSYILELLKAGVVEVHPDGEGDMRNDVLVVRHSEGAQSRWGEDCVGFVAHARLTEVVHTHSITRI